MQAISAIGIFASLVYLLLLLSKKEKNYSDRILIAWMTIFPIHLSLPFMMALGNEFFIEEVDGLDIGFYSLHLAFLYYYTQSLMKRFTFFKWRHLVLLIPALSVYMIQYTLDANTHLLVPLIDAYFLGSIDVFHLSGVVTLNLLFCLLFSIILFDAFHSHRTRMRENYSFSEKVSLNWVRNLVVASVVLTAILLFFLFLLLNGWIGREWINNVYFSAFSLLAIALGFWGYRQGNIPVYVKAPGRSEDLRDDQTSQPEEVQTRYASELEQLKSYMETKKPYLNPELSIGELANELDMHVYKLSRVINEASHQNFYEFINSFRLNEFKRMVADPANSHFSILGLAYDSGFNSKATFNRIFKEFTGQTPSEFRSNYMFNLHEK